MTRRIIRESALRIAVDVFKDKQNEKADQSRIVPDSVERQREMKSPGKYVMPEYGNSVHDDMTRERPSSKYGQQVFGPGYEEYSEPDEYVLHPAMMAVLGGLGQTFTSLYVNQPVNGKLTPQEASASKAMANGIKKQAAFQQKSVKRIAEGWLYQNKDTVKGNVAYATLSQLNLGIPERSVDNSVYNFGARRISSPLIGD